MKNCRPIYLLNVDLDITKALFKKLETAIPDLISPQQSVHVKNTRTDKSGSPMSDILEIAKIKTSLLVITDTEIN